MAPGPYSGHAANPATLGGQSGPRNDAPRPQPAPAPVRATQPRELPAPEIYDLEDPARPGRRFPLKTAAAFILLCGLGGGAFALHKSGRLAITLPFITASQTANQTGDAPVVAAAKAEPKQPPLADIGGSGTAEGVDQGLQKSTLWQVIKREFPDWYSERVQDTVKLRGEQKDDKAVSGFLTTALIDLRRKNTDAVLASSPDRLKFVAVTFVENLSKLAKHSTEACYSYISQGESSPIVMELMRSPEHTSSLQAQFKAIIEAAVEGRRLPKSYKAPSREDYDVLAVELAARGWTPVDLQTFSDAKALARATPERVCKMVQDWFQAQLSVKDEDVQLRLLVEALKPVVAG